MNSSLKGMPARIRSAWSPETFKTLTMPIILLCLCILFYLLEPRFATTTNILNLLRQTSILTIAVYGQLFVIVSGDIDLSSGAIAALVSMTTALVAKEFGIIPGFSCGLLAGCILGSINGSLVGWFRIPAFIATAGMFTYGRALAWWLGGGLPIEFMPPGYEFLGGGRIFGIPMPVVTAAILLIPVHLILTRTILGRFLYSIGGNKEAARLSGVRIAPYRVLAFVISGLFAAIAGIVLSSRIVAGHPGIAIGLEFQAIAAIAIGGVSLGGGEGNVFRAVTGAIIIGVIANGMNLANISTYFQQMAFGAIMVISAVIDVSQRGRSRIGQKKS